jgi:hypothetical protein
MAKRINVPTEVREKINKLIDLYGNTIRVECEGKNFFRHDEFINLQGDLKTLLDTNFIKLIESILVLGFSFPVFYWIDKTTKPETKYIIDAHQRINVLNILERAFNFKIPKLPAIQIFAKDKVEAKKKLLALNSHYGDMSEETLYEYINEVGAEIDVANMDYLRFNFDVKNFIDGYGKEDAKIEFLEPKFEEEKMTTIKICVYQTRLEDLKKDLNDIKQKYSEMAIYYEV